MKKVAIEIKTNSEDSYRCSIKCSFALKERGFYNCTLFNGCIDTGEDDESGYGFVRLDECRASELK